MRVNQQIQRNDKKCYNCGKVFSTGQALERHKNRKTPCLIREVAPEQINNPNRCIFCNKIFTNIGNRNKHLKTCKIKNGGMNILDDKVRYEQEIRILKERDREKEQQIQQLIDKVATLEQAIAAPATPSPPQTIVNNGVINNGPVNITINFNDYNRPCTDRLDLTQDDLLAENITLKLIEKIYFNRNIPENHTLYLPNVKENRLLVHRQGAWENISGDAIKPVLTDVKNAAYSVGTETINGKIYRTDDDFARLYPVVRQSIQSFNTGGDHARCSDTDIMNIILGKRNVIRDTLCGAGIIKK